MKRLKNVKHIKLIISLLVLVAVCVGSTYAWWTATKMITQDINMGNLAIEATFDKFDDSLNYEPGLTVDFSGRVTNTGSIPVIIRVENSSKIRVKGEETYNPVNKEAVKISVQPDINTSNYWYQDNNKNIYLMLEPGGKTDMNLVCLLDGEVMGSEYMGSQIKFSGEFHATQVLEGAIMSEFGIDGSELIELENGRSKRSIADESPAMKALHDKLNRHK